MHKIGIIGYGKMGRIRHEAMDELGNCEVIAISEPTIGNDYKGIQNLTHQEIINHPAIDSIIICTPNYLNKPLAISALKAGKHVFCEKPPAFTEADIKEIREVEKAAKGIKLMYGFNHRHHDSIIQMKELIDSDEYGKVIWMRGRYGKSVTADYYNEWRSKKEIAGGGILLDQGIHMLDLFLYLGGNFNKVKAEVSNLYWQMDTEDNAFVILKNTKTGMAASLHSTMTQWRHLFSLEIFLEKGYMVLNGMITSSMSYGEEVLSVAKSRSAAPAATWHDEERTTYSLNNSWRYEMEHFFKAIDNDKPITIGNSKDAQKLMRIIDKCYKEKDF
jgi:1,5-anhydro-D-fructose reductase (1,5-anhydro-D-mannitol-forming)